MSTDQTPTRPGQNAEYDEIMGWLAPAMVEGAQAALDDAEQAVRDAAADLPAVPGAYWGRNAETAPANERELATLEAADDAAVDQALKVLDSLLRKAAGNKDLTRRSRMLARLDRALADPRDDLGYLARLGALRTATLAERAAAGVPVRTLATEGGVSERRIRQILAGNPSYVSADLQAVKDGLARQRAARASARRAQDDARRAETLAQGRLWNARTWAGETVKGIADADGVPWQRVASAVKAARAEAADDQAAEG